MEEWALQKVVEEAGVQGVMITTAKRLRGQEMVEARRSIRLAVAGALTTKEMEKAVGVVKAALVKVLVGPSYMHIMIMCVLSTVLGLRYPCQAISKPWGIALAEYEFKFLTGYHVAAYGTFRVLLVLTQFESRFASSTGVDSTRSASSLLDLHLCRPRPSHDIIKSDIRSHVPGA